MIGKNTLLKMLVILTLINIVILAASAYRHVRTREMIHSQLWENGYVEYPADKETVAVYKERTK